MNNIDKTQTVGQLVARFPYTVDVLNKYQIDYAFKGNVPLMEILQKQHLSEYDVIGELDLSVDEFKLMNDSVIYWENEPIGKILDFIEGKHHKFLKKTMSDIDKIIHDLPENDAQTKSLEKMFVQLKEEMETHQDKEEKELFPLLREYENSRDNELRKTIVKYMVATENEHDDAGILFKKINNLTDNFTVPFDKSENYTKVIRLLDALEKDTFIHVHMENSILFKMV